LCGEDDGFAISDLRFEIEKTEVVSSIANRKLQIANPSALLGVAYGLSVPDHRLLAAGDAGFYRSMRDSWP
jgi:hypothetical protein